jgi:hemoglobin-like flavoprotein
MAHLSTPKETNMTPDRIAHARATLARLRSSASLAGELFYMELFAIAPHLRAKFPADVSAQARKLVEMLSLLVDLLDRPEALRGELVALGRRHLAYGVHEDHYDAVGVALLHMLRSVLGTDFSVEAEEAWGELYGATVETMIGATA